ncbi:MAG: S9 family peptidase [Candidatus Zixiibacteriota bacterium]
MKRVALSLLLVLAATATAVAVETHPFSVHDMVAMDRISEPMVSPDGKQVVFVLRKTDLEANRGRTDLWLVGVDGTNLRQLTTDPAGDFNPRWSPDGKSIWFLSTRSGSAQVWRLPLTGGEAEQITKLPLDVGNLILSPDGKWLAFSLEVFVGASDPDSTQKRLDAIAARKYSGQIFERLFVRHWDTWKDGRRSHIFVMPANGGAPKDIMPAMDADAPSKPFGGTEEFTFTPDSRGLIFAARDAGREEPWSTNFDLYYVPVDGSQAPRNLTDANKAWDTQPLFSPDGRTLAYLAMARPGYEADCFKLMLRQWPEGTVRSLTANWDRSVGSFCWSPDGKTIFAVAGHIGNSSLFAINAATGAAKVVIRNGTVSSPSIAGNRLVYGLDNYHLPVELFTARVDGQDVRQITRVNAEKLAAVRMGDFEQFNFIGANDDTVWGYVVKPVDFTPGKKYPVAFLIHGGPQGSFDNHFHYRWNPQAYAGAGYAVVTVDFHGSTGYGQAFTDAIGGDWGGKPLVDLQEGLATALAKYQWMDGDKVGALGASFGGYMVNWIAGNWPDRFLCLVNHDGNLDERLAYFDTEELWFPEWDHHGTPWDNPDGYEKQNPINYVKYWTTPMLVVHGGNDFRIPYAQGISTFTALQRRNIPSKFLYFPDENHWVLKPQNSILWHESVLGWLDRWLK